MRLQLSSSREIDLDEARGSLLFMDNPDPPNLRQVNSRLAVHIRDEAHLPTLLERLRYR
jgi:hypothetical protein